MENKFFTFLNPILELIDDGAFFRKPFRWLYMLLAALNLLVPIGVLVAAIDNHVFNAGGKFVVAFIVLFLIICGLSWFGFQPRSGSCTDTPFACSGTCSARSAGDAA